MTIHDNRAGGLPEHVIEKILTVFKQHPQIKHVFLYGSRAIGTYRTGSDIDLCIEGETLDFNNLLHIETQLDDLLLPWNIDLSLKHQIDNPELLHHIQEHGIVFYP
jgi:predicted nucleotidyltransferase